MKQIYLVVATIKGIKGIKRQIYTFGAFTESIKAEELKEKLYKTRNINAEIKVIILNAEKDVYIGSE